MILNHKLEPQCQLNETGTCALRNQIVNYASIVLESADILSKDLRSLTNQTFLNESTLLGVGTNLVGFMTTIQTQNYVDRF